MCGFYSFWEFLFFFFLIRENFRKKSISSSFFVVARIEFFIAVYIYLINDLVPRNFFFSFFVAKYIYIYIFNSRINFVVVIVAV